jgi:hypothetical protein
VDGRPHERRRHGADGLGHRDAGPPLGDRGQLPHRGEPHAPRPIGVPSPARSACVCSTRPRRSASRSAATAKWWAARSSAASSAWRASAAAAGDRMAAPPSRTVSGPTVSGVVGARHPRRRSLSPCFMGNPHEPRDRSAQDARDRGGRLRHTVDAHLDHGQSRRPPQPSSPHARRAPRSWADARTAAAVFATRSMHTSIMGRRDGRDELCRVAARTTGVTRRASPSDLPGAPRGPCGETRAHDVRGFARRRIAAAAQQRTCRAHDARSCARTRLTGVECSEHATPKARARVGVTRASVASNAPSTRR